MRVRRPVPTALHHLDAGAFRPWSRHFAAAASLHAHTWYSREPLAFIEPCAARIPLIRRLMQREIARHRQRSGHLIDFSQAFFRPPMHARSVHRCEVEQIARTLDVSALVSITDHDSIKSGQVLRSSGVEPSAPISLEWTVPFGAAVFHLGVHDLPPNAANAVLRELIAYTGRRGRSSLGDLLAWLSSFPQVLVVLNHPFWDLTGSGAAEHRAQLLGFLAAHRQRIHALELNGYRTHAENLTVTALAGQCGVPIVGGGDRHGRQANAVLNLTAATSFDEFVAEVRQLGRSTILFMPAYRHSLRLRKMQTAADILCDAAAHPEGCRHWTDRIYYRNGGPFRRLRDHWPAGSPRWLDLLVFAVTHTPFAAASRLTAARRHEPAGATTT
jgi:hypothetical protein